MEPRPAIIGAPHLQLVFARKVKAIGFEKGYEPLQKIVHHFAQCMSTRNTPLTNVEAGQRFVRISKVAQRAITMLREKDHGLRRWVRISRTIGVYRF